MELSLTYFELYEDIGIKLLKGVILYGVLGIGKMLLVKVVVNLMSVIFLCIVGFELI